MFASKALSLEGAFFILGGGKVNGSTVFDYYYGDESSQFSFYRIPRQLVTGQQFKKISTDAKLLYGLLLDRMGLSARNSWYDDAGRVYIFYTLDEIQEDLNCGHEKAVKLLSELDTDKGCGLIERMKQGQGKPTKIYVKRFTTRQVTAETIVPQEVPRLPKIGSQEVGKSEVKSSEKQKSRLPVFGSLDFLPPNEVFDIDFGRLALPLFLALNQANPSILVQFLKQLYQLILAEPQELNSLLQCEVDIDPPIDI